MNETAIEDNNGYVPAFGQDTDEPPTCKEGSNMEPLKISINKDLRIAEGEAAADSSGTATPASIVEAISTLGKLVRERADVRSAMATLGHWLLEISRPIETRSESPMEPVAPATAAPVTREQAAMELQLGGVSIPVTVPVDKDTALIAHQPTLASAPSPAVEMSPATADDSVPDLQIVIERTRLKAESCRWGVERRRRVNMGADFEQEIRPKNDELIRRAKSMYPCFLWAMDTFNPQSVDNMTLAASCYDNLASAAELIQQIRQAPKPEEWREGAYALLAEAQSALRALIESMELRPDADQENVFRWLRIHTELDHVHVEKYMRWNHRAKPADWFRLSERISQLRVNWQARRDLADQRKQFLGKIHYHSQRLRKSHDGGDRRDWDVLCDTIARALESGLPPSNIELREEIFPIADEVPEDLVATPHMRQVLTEIDRYVSSRESSGVVAPQAEVVESRVAEVRRLLCDKTAVLIGGERRTDSEMRLQMGLGLSRLVWITTREHQSHYDFESQIIRPEVALVMLAIRWSSHSFENVKSICDAHGKPFVRLPFGYGVNQVAHQILEQVSDQLGGT